MKVDLNNIKNAFARNDFQKTLDLCENYKKNNLIKDEFLFIENIKGISFLNLKKFDQSEKSFLACVEKNPKNIETLYNLLNLYIATSKFNECINILKKILSLNPHYLKAYYVAFKLNNLLSKQDHINDIENIFLKLTTLDLEKFVTKDLIIFINFLSKNNELKISKFLCEQLLSKKNEIIFFLYSLIQKKLGNYKISLKYLKLTIGINETNALYLHEAGSIYEILGDIKNAKIYFLKSIDADNKFGSSYRSLSNINALDSSLVAKLKEKIKFIKENNFLMHAYFALSKHYEDCNDYDQSYFYFTKANLIRRNQLSNDNKKIKNIIKFYQYDINNLNLFNINLSKKNNFEPIFLVGLPRSGSTLVEQILNNHSKIKGYGEIDILQNLLEKKIFNSDKNLINENAATNSNLFFEIRNKYFEFFTPIEKTKLFFTDKMLFNFFYIEAISKIFPYSKIVICKRDLRDIFVSIIKNYFGSAGLKFAYSPSDLYDFIKIYAQTINYFNNKNIKNLYTICYEKIVSNTEYEINELLKFIGLEFEPECLNYHKKRNEVATASSFQVRSKIYTKSVNLWSNYEKFYTSEFKKLDKLNQTI